MSGLILVFWKDTMALIIPWRIFNISKTFPLDKNLFILEKDYFDY